MEKADNKVGFAKMKQNLILCFLLCTLCGYHSCVLLKPADCYYNFCASYFHHLNRILEADLLDHFPRLADYKQECVFAHFMGCPDEWSFEHGSNLERKMKQKSFSGPTFFWSSVCYDDMYRSAMAICFTDSVKILHMTEEISKQEVLVYKANYSDTNNLYIRLFHNQFVYQTCSFCNNAANGLKPIPYFADYDFGLGSLTDSILTDSGSREITSYITPDDLDIIVLDAQTGWVFEYECLNLTRPNSLGEWKHGWSKGFAVSEKHNLIVFWAMVW